MKQIISKSINFSSNDSYLTWDFRFSDGSFVTDYRVYETSFNKSDISFVAQYGFQLYYFHKSSKICYLSNILIKLED